MWPLIEIAIEPKSKADQEKLGVALRNLAAEDPTLRVSTDAGSGQTILGGISEEQLDRVTGALKRTYRIEADIGAPQVAYREVLGRKTEVDHTYRKHFGPMSQFARVKIVFEPNEPGVGYAFESKIAGGAVPKAFIPGVERGLESAKDSGLLAGFPVIDFRATLIDGAYSDIDSSVTAFEMAAHEAFKALRDKGAPKLVEPIMKLEVQTPDEYLGDVIGDLNRRRGQIQGADQRVAAHVIIAMVPLVNMLGYASALRQMTEDRASFEMQYSHYEPLPLPGPPDDTFPPAAAMRA